MKKIILLILVCIGYLYPQASNTIPRRVDTLETDVDSLYTYWVNKHEAQTITGQKNFSGGIVSPQTDSLFTKTSHIVNVKEFGAVGDGSTDDTQALQNAVDYCLGSTNDAIKLVLPAGKFRLSNTWKIGYGDTFKTIEIMGVGGYGDAPSGTIIDASELTDVPAINIQGMRNVLVSGITIIGGNTAPYTKATANEFDADTSLWVDSGLSNGRYNPYSGITIDAYSGTGGVGFYDNDDYGRATSSYIKLENLTVRNFVVGIMISPADYTSLGNMVIVDDCIIAGNTYGIASGQSQARGLVIQNSTIAGSHTLFTNNTFGKQNGTPPQIFGGDWGLCRRIFDLQLTTGAMGVYGLYAESIMEIGQLSVASSANISIIFESCGFSFIKSTNYVSSTPLITYASTIFNGGFFNTYKGVFNVAGAGNISFNGVTFQSSATWDDIYYIRVVNAGLSLDVSLNDCDFYTGYWNGSAKENINNNVRLYSFPDRLEYNYNSKFINTNDSIYYFSNPYSNTYIGIATSSYSWNEDTLSFTDNNSLLLMGDIISWRTILKGAYQYTLPMLQVVEVNGTNITAVCLFDKTEYDTTYSPSSLALFYRYWASYNSITGDITNGADTIKNITDADDYLNIGDFIISAGLQSYTRVIGINGTDIAISKTATGTGERELYFGKIKNIRPSPKDLDNQDDVIDLIETYIPNDTTGLYGNNIYVDYNTGQLRQTRPANVITNGDFSDWTNGYPDGWNASGFDTTHCSIEESPSGVLHFQTDGSCGSLYQNGATIGIDYGYSFEIVSITGAASIYFLKDRVDVTALGKYSGISTATNPTFISITRYYTGLLSCDMQIDNIKIWQISGGQKEAIYYPHESSITLLQPAISDTIVLYGNKEKFYDSLKVFDVLDSICVGMFYRTDADYNMITIPDTLTTGDFTIFINNSDVPEEAKVYIYFIYLGDSEAYLRGQIYWRERE
jgi:hypothetical protein